MRLLILIAAAIAISGCESIRKGQWAETPTFSSPKEPRQCRLLYRSDWSETWLECRQCTQMGDKVECPQ